MTGVKNFHTSSERHLTKGGRWKGGVKRRKDFQTNRKESKVRSWRKAEFIQPDFLILPYSVSKICPRIKTLAPSSKI